MMVVVKESHFEVKNIVTVWDKIWLVFEEVKYFVRPSLPNVAHPTGIKRDTRVHVKIPGSMIGHRVSFSSLFGLNIFSGFCFVGKDIRWVSERWLPFQPFLNALLFLIFPLYFLINQCSQIIFTFFILWKITYLFRLLIIWFVFLLWEKHLTRDWERWLPLFSLFSSHYHWMDALMTST